MIYILIDLKLLPAKICSSGTKKNFAKRCKQHIYPHSPSNDILTALSPFLSPCVYSCIWGSGIVSFSTETILKNNHSYIQSFDKNTWWSLLSGPVIVQLGVWIGGTWRQIIHPFKTKKEGKMVLEVPENSFNNAIWGPKDSLKLHKVDQFLEILKSKLHIDTDTQPTKQKKLNLKI